MKQRALSVTFKAASKVAVEVAKSGESFHINFREHSTSTIIHSANLPPLQTTATADTRTSWMVLEDKGDAYPMIKGAKWMWGWMDVGRAVIFHGINCCCAYLV